MPDLALRILMQTIDQGATAGVGKLGGALTGLATPILATGAALVGLGVVSTKMAGDFESGLTGLVTGAGEAQKNLKMVGDGIKQTSVATGTSTKDLTAAMFQIESSGAHGAAGLQELAAASRGAKVGSADLGVTANALTTILTDYHMSASQSASAMNGLTVTVQSGKTHLQDLASSMGSVLPLASSLGISFPQVAGGIAVMTNAGEDAQRAAQNLGNTIRSLAAPNAAAEKSMAAVGLSAQQLKDTLSTQGLTGAIKLVEEHVGKTFPAGSVEAVQAFKHIMGGATGYNVALMLGGKNMQSYEANVKNITSAMKDGSGTILGWADVQKDFNFRVDQGRAALNVMLITIGQALLPVISQLVANMTPVITGLTTWITKSGVMQSITNGLTVAIQAVSTAVSVLVTIGTGLVKFFQSNQTAMDVLKVGLMTVAGVIASIVVGAFVAWAVAAGSAAVATLAAAAPVLLIGAAIGLLIGVLVLLYTHVKGVHDAMDNLGHGVQTVFKIMQTQVSQGMAIIARDTEINSLKMKTSADQHTIDMAKKSIANIQVMKDGLIQELEGARSASERHMLLMKLDALNKSEQEQKGVIANATKMRQGVQAQLEQLDPVAKLHTLQMKDHAVKNTLVMAQQSVSNLSEMRTNLENQMLHTRDAVARHSLGMQLDSIDKAIKQKDGVIAQMTLQKAGIEKNITGIKKSMTQDNSNILVQALGAWNKFQVGLGQAGSAIWKVMQSIGAYLASTFKPVWDQLVSTFNTKVMPAWNSLLKALKPLMPELEAFGAAIVGVVVIAIGIFIAIIGGLLHALASALSGIISIFGGIVSVISGAIKIGAGIIALFIDLVTGQFGNLGTDLGTIMDGIGTMFSGMWQIIKGIFQTVFGAIIGFCAGFIQTIIGFFQHLYDILVGHSIVPDMINAIIDFFKSLPGAIFATIQNFVNWIIARFQDLWNGAVRIFTGLKNDVINGVTVLKNDAVSLLTTLENNFLNSFERIRSGVIQKATDLKNGIGGVMRGFIDNIIGMLNNGITGVENFVNFFGKGINWVAEKLGHSDIVPNITLARIPAYASGTAHHPGGPAIVGEQGPELVMLPRGASVLKNSETQKLLKSMHVPGYANGIGDVLGDIGSFIAGGAQGILDTVLKKFNVSLSLPGALSSIASSALDKVKSWALSFIQGILPSIGGGSAGPGKAVNVPGNVASWIASAIGLTGVPGNWLSALETIAMHESGGNPNAVNNTDINAQEGHPSQGLMQTIPSTFAAYMAPGHGNILNPIDNAAAAINYIKSRYGSVFQVPGIISMASGGAYQGYANGGIINEHIVGIGLATGKKYQMGEKGAEAVIPLTGHHTTTHQKAKPPTPSHDTTMSYAKAEAMVRALWQGKAKYDTTMKSAINELIKGPYADLHMKTLTAQSTAKQAKADATRLHLTNPMGQWLASTQKLEAALTKDGLKPVIAGGLAGIKVAINDSKALMKSGQIAQANQLNLQINQSQEAIDHQKEMTALLKWSQQRHKAGDTFKWKGQSDPQGLFATKTWFGSAGGLTQTNPSTTNVTIHVHTQANDPKIVAKEVSTLLDRKYRQQGQHPSGASGNKVK